MVVRVRKMVRSRVTTVASARVKIHRIQAIVGFHQTWERELRLMANRSSGFTLIEVLIALAITAFVSIIAYTSLSTVMSGVESLRANTDRIYEINRAMMILSRDLRQFADRSVRDEFGEIEPAMTGGELARFTLSFTRRGWHNPNGHPRSSLQRVNYRLEDGAHPALSPKPHKDLEWNL